MLKIKTIFDLEIRRFHTTQGYICYLWDYHYFHQSLKGSLKSLARGSVRRKKTIQNNKLASSVEKVTAPQSCQKNCWQLFFHWISHWIYCIDNDFTLEWPCSHIIRLRKLLLHQILSNFSKTMFAIDLIENELSFDFNIILIWISDPLIKQISNSTAFHWNRVVLWSLC